MDNNTINISDDSGSDETYCPSNEDNKHLRDSQPRQIQTRHRKYDQKSHSQTQAHNDEQSHTHTHRQTQSPSQTQSQNEQSPSHTQSQNSQQSDSQTQYETQKTPCKDKDKDVDKDIHTESESQSPTVNRSQRATNRDAKKRAIERGTSSLNNLRQGGAEAAEPETKKKIEIDQVLFGNMLCKSQYLIRMVRRKKNRCSFCGRLTILHVKVATLQQQELICLRNILLSWIEMMYLDYKMRIQMDKVLGD